MPAADAAIDPSKEARELIEFAAGLFFPLSPSLATVYTDEVRERLAEKGAPVLKKYGLNLSALFGRWDAEIGFAIVAVPLIAPTIEAIRADRQAAARPAPPGVPVPDPSAAADDAAART